MSGALIWVIVVVVVLVLIAVIVGIVSMSRKRREAAHRERAEELREHAATQATGLQQHDARAKETEARAAQAKAEAERKQAEAQRLEAEAEERRRAADEHREQHHETLREADEVDPDVDTRHDEYRGPDGVQSVDQDRVPERSHAQDEVGEHPAATPHAGTADEADQTRTVTHPDGSTESVQDPDRTEGTHRA
jgi:hypothetical protein